MAETVRIRSIDTHALDLTGFLAQGNAPERAGELEAEIEELVADRARYEYELQDYEQTVAAFGY